MRFEVLRKSYINDDLCEPGQIIDIDESKLAFVDGKLDMRKHSTLKPLDDVEILDVDGLPVPQSGIDAELKGVKTGSKDDEGSENPLEGLSPEDIQAIKDAAEALDPATDAMWTGEGKPDLKALKAVTGITVKRSHVDAILPEFTRPQSE